MNPTVVTTPPTNPNTGEEGVVKVLTNDRVHMLNTARSRSASPNVINSGRSTGVKSGTGLFKAMTLIEYKGLRFIIMDAPSDTNIVHYAKELVKHGVTDVCRACEPTYTMDSLKAFHLNVHELSFKDGEPPPPQIISQWLQLVASKFPIAGGASSPPSTTVNITDTTTSNTLSGNTIAVHCVAGLGRAPVLVAVALIEAGMNPLEAVEYIRSKRRGALNMKQIHFLDHYKRRVGKGKSSGNAAGDSKCCIM